MNWAHFDSTFLPSEQPRHCWSAGTSGRSISSGSYTSSGVGGGGKKQKGDCSKQGPETESKNRRVGWTKKRICTFLLSSTFHESHFPANRLYGFLTQGSSWLPDSYMHFGVSVSMTCISAQRALEHCSRLPKPVKGSLLSSLWAPLVLNPMWV
jgi:hypothetical protein